MFELFGSIIPVIVIGAFVFLIGKLVFTTANNLSQDEIARPAIIIGRRQSTHVHGGHNNMPASSSTTSLVTFQFEDGSREELTVPGREYGLLAEGDQGVLRSRGTWYKGFERTGRIS